MNESSPSYYRLKELLADDQTSISTVLRQGKILAAKLRAEPFSDWLDRELNGYGPDREVPEYRRHRTQLLGTFAGPTAKATNVLIPVSSMPEEFHEPLTTVVWRNPVRELEELSQGEESRHRLPHELMSFIGSTVSMGAHMRLVDAWQPVTPYALSGIVDAVRNRLLDFLLELEAEEPDLLDSYSVAESLDRERVVQIFNTTISGSQNVVAAGKEFSQALELTVAPGNEKDLATRLKEVGIPDDEVAKVVALAKEEGVSQDREFGPRLQAWLGRATEKVYSGAWKTATTAAPQLLVKALSQYYGWGG